MIRALKETNSLEQTLSEYAEIAQNLDLGMAVGENDNETTEHYAEINVASRLKALEAAENN